MPSKTARGGANKTHNRGSSASSTTKLNLNLTTAALARNKSAEKIGKRNSADVTANFRAAPPRPPPPPPLQVDVASGGGGGGGGDDDEWVSSESGAVTPADYDEDDSPPSPDDDNDNDNDTDVEPMPSTTPRGEHPHRPPLQPPPPPPPQSRPRPQSHASLQRLDTAAAAERGHSHSSLHSKSHSQQRSPDSLRDAPLNSAVPARRPPSVRGPARPHPLIRARSYAPAPSSSPIVAPATVSSSHATSPASEHAPTTHSLRRQNSRSSVTSVATLPLPSTVAGTAVTRVHSERHRPRSGLTSAALSSLAAATHAHAPSRPPSPQFAVAFPPAHPRDEQVHVMIPPPLVPTHVSATAHQNPFLEALQRVTEAKVRAGR